MDIDLGTFPIFNVSDLNLVDSKTITDFIRDTGCLIVRDSSVDMLMNETFLDMMERYFSQTTEEKLEDARPNLCYQVGCTPEGIELSRCAQDPKCLEFISSQPPEHRAEVPRGHDPKWRYMWRIGKYPERTMFNELNSEQVVPKRFATEWLGNMDTWGNALVKVVYKVASILEDGLEMPPTTLTSLLNGGSHLLSPTGTDLAKYNEIRTPYAGYHCDISFLTIHGRSRFPGLFIWLRDGTKVPVKVPPGCLLLQVGTQLEHITGGYLKAGYHQVVCTQDTKKAMATAKCHWRVSSTLFSHVCSDKELRPFGKFNTPLCQSMYPPMLAGDFIRKELLITKLAEIT